MRNFTNLMLCFFLTIGALNAQSVILQGYVFESNNRGYISQVGVQVFDAETKALLATIPSDNSGKFQIQLPVGRTYIIKTRKDLFEDKETTVSSVGKLDGEKIFHKIEMDRKPGYIFDVTIAGKRTKPDAPVDAIQNTWIEVYNNTTQQEVLNLKNHPSPYFKITFEQGNHYTLMIRKKGYFNKRMEAYVNVEGCILCFEGVGTVQPGVADVLTEGHMMGTLLANVELEPIEIEKSIELKNIYYDYNKWDISEKSALELDKVVNMMKDNPALFVELGSHTDSRGKAGYNQELSEKRAKAAVDYIVAVGGVERKQISYKGYGESKLVNRCKDGVECSERRHQQNRRTEIKVIGISGTDPMEQKTLAQIKEEEQFEALLKQLDDQQVIKVMPGEELPDEIKEQISKEAASDKVEVTEGTTMVSASDQQPIAKQNSKSEMHQQEQETKPPNVVEDMDVLATETTPTTDMDESNSNGSLIVQEAEVMVPVYTKKTKALSEYFTGYMVEFYRSAEVLPNSHSIFALHGSITLEKTKKGDYAYLLGEFEDWRDANKFLNSILLSQYPNARLIRYKKGKRLTE